MEICTPAPKCLSNRKDHPADKAFLAEELGREIDDLTTKLEVAAANQDIAWPGGVIRAVTVAGQHCEWIAWSNGAPIITYHCYWTMGEGSIDAQWNAGPSGYRIHFEGEPEMEMFLGAVRGSGKEEYFGPRWTEIAGVNAIQAVCDADPGFITEVGESFD